MDKIVYVFGMIGSLGAVGLGIVGAVLSCLKLTGGR